MEKELHIWMGENWRSENKNVNELIVTLESAEKALHSNKSRVDTTQTHVCSTKWLQKCYRLFVHMLDNTVVEIKLGQNDSTNRIIKETYNLEKLLLAGEFGPATQNL